MANNALSFGGNTSYVGFGTADPGAGSFAVGGWIKWGGAPNTANSSQCMFSKHNSFGTQRWWFGLDKVNSFKCLVYGNGGSFPFWNYIPPSDGTAVHLVWVHDTTNTVEKLYVNGAFHSNLTGIALGSGTGETLQLGASSSGGAERTKGDMDGWFINTTLLSAANIANIYNGTDPNSITGAWATWHLDEGTGTSTADSTGSNTGTLSGSTLPTWITGFETVAAATARGRLSLLGVS